MAAEAADIIDVRIYYHDTDCGGVVYYGHYLKYFEHGRTHWLEARGLSVKSLMDAGTLFTVVHAELFYRSPARYGDTLTVTNAQLASQGTYSVVVSNFVNSAASDYAVLTVNTNPVAPSNGLRTVGAGSAWKLFFVMRSKVNRVYQKSIA